MGGSHSKLYLIGLKSIQVQTCQLYKQGIFTKISCKIFYETAQPIWTKLCHCVVPILNCIQLVLAPSKMATVTKTKTLMVNGPKQLYLKPESAKIVTWRSWLGALRHIFLLLWSISEIRHIFFWFVQVNDTSSCEHQVSQFFSRYEVSSNSRVNINKVDIKPIKPVYIEF